MENESWSPDEEPRGLRERRRRETGREIADAALSLFETKGVGSTTVDDIAQLSGVSARTIFRYFPTKEHTLFGALRDEPETGLEARIRAAASDETTLATIEREAARAVKDFDDHPEDHERALRFRRLLLSEPSLLALALALDAERQDRMTAAIVDRSGGRSGGRADEILTRTLVALVGTTVRLAHDEWARRRSRGVTSSLRETYDLHRAALERYLSTEL